MRSSSVIASVFLAITSLVAAQECPATTGTIQLSFTTTDGLNKNPTYAPGAALLNQLTVIGDANGVQTSGIKITGVTSDLDITHVECRAYSDSKGLLVGSAPFTSTKPAAITTQIVQIASILCYLKGST